MALINCPKCERPLKLAPENEGRRVQCTCGAILQMPSAKRERNVAHGSTQQAVQQRVTNEVPEYHKRKIAKKKRAARARELAEERRNEKSRQTKQDENNSVSPFVWIGVLQIVGGGIGLIAGMLSGYIYYLPIFLIVSGLMTAIWGALFGANHDDWDD